MRENHENRKKEFFGDDGRSHTLIPAATIIAVPEAKAEAERAGQQVRIDFLDDEAVLWMLEQRHLDAADRRTGGTVLGLALGISIIGLGVFWVGVASQKSQRFELTIALPITVIVAMLILFLARRNARSLFDPKRRNVRIRARLYRKIAIKARKGGADIPLRYPHYGMYAAARKFFPEADDLPMPHDSQKGDPV